MLIVPSGAGNGRAGEGVGTAVAVGVDVGTELATKVAVGDGRFEVCAGWTVGSSVGEGVGVRAGDSAGDVLLAHAASTLAVTSRETIMSDILFILSSHG